MVVFCSSIPPYGIGPTMYFLRTSEEIRFKMNGDLSSPVALRTARLPVPTRCQIHSFRSYGRWTSTQPSVRKNKGDILNSQIRRKPTDTSKRNLLSGVSKGVTPGFPHARHRNLQKKALSLSLPLSRITFALSNSDGQQQLHVEAGVPSAETFQLSSDLLNTLVN